MEENNRRAPTLVYLMHLPHRQLEIILLERVLGYINPIFDLLRHMLDPLMNFQMSCEN